MSAEADQTAAKPKLDVLRRLPSRSLQFIRSLPFHVAAWKDERRDLKLLNDVEYYNRRSPMGYNK